MKKHRQWGLLLSLLLVVAVKVQAQQVAVKTNLLYDAALLTPNASVEASLGRKHSIELMGALNLFSYSNNKKLKHWLLQPEWRYWFCSRYNGWFLGVHAHGGQFNMGNYKLPFGLLPMVKKHRYEGWFAGGGVSVGYQWPITKRWGLEAELGAGYTYVDYRKYNCARCGVKQKDGARGIWGPTRAAISLVYILN